MLHVAYRVKHRHQCVSLLAPLTLVFHIVASTIVHPMIIRKLGTELQHERQDKSHFFSNLSLLTRGRSVLVWFFLLSALCDNVL